MVLTLLDKTGRELGGVVPERMVSGRVVGRFEPHDFPKEIRSIFDRHAEVVECQMFSLLDQCEMEIEGLGLAVRGDDGKVRRVTDVQIMYDMISFAYEVTG